MDPGLVTHSKYPLVNSHSWLEYPQVQCRKYIFKLVHFPAVAMLVDPGSVSFVLECLTYPIQLGREDEFPSRVAYSWKNDGKMTFTSFWQVSLFFRASICTRGWILCWCQNTSSITARVEWRFLWVVEGYPIDAVLLDQKDSGRILSH